jgi:hypothetical protein
MQLLRARLLLHFFYQQHDTNWNILEILVIKGKEMISSTTSYSRGPDFESHIEYHDGVFIGFFFCLLRTTNFDNI